MILEKLNLEKIEGNLTVFRQKSYHKVVQFSLWFYH